MNPEGPPQPENGDNRIKEQKEKAQELLTPVVAQIHTRKLTFDALDIRSTTSREKYWKESGITDLGQQIKTFDDAVQQFAAGNKHNPEAMAALQSLGLDPTSNTWNEQITVHGVQVNKQVEHFRFAYVPPKRNANDEQASRTKALYTAIAVGCPLNEATGNIDLIVFEKRLNAVKPLLGAFGMNEEEINIPEMTEKLAIYQALRLQQHPMVAEGIEEVFNDRVRSYRTVQETNGLEELTRIQRRLDGGTDPDTRTESPHPDVPRTPRPFPLDSDLPEGVMPDVPSAPTQQNAPGDKSDERAQPAEKREDIKAILEKIKSANRTVQLIDGTRRQLDQQLAIEEITQTQYNEWVKELDDKFAEVQNIYLNDFSEMRVVLAQYTIDNETFTAHINGVEEQIAFINPYDLHYKLTLQVTIEEDQRGRHYPLVPKVLLEFPHDWDPLQKKHFKKEAQKVYEQKYWETLLPELELNDERRAEIEQQVTQSYENAVSLEKVTQIQNFLVHVSTKYKDKLENFENITDDDMRRILDTDDAEKYTEAVKAMNQTQFFLSTLEQAEYTLRIIQEKTTRGEMTIANLDERLHELQTLYLEKSQQTDYSALSYWETPLLIAFRREHNDDEVKFLMPLIPPESPLMPPEAPERLDET